MMLGISQKFDLLQFDSLQFNHNVYSLIYSVFHDNRASHSEKKRYQYLLKKGLGRDGYYGIFKKMREFL